MRKIIKSLTAVFIFSILLFCVLVVIGLHTHDPLLRDSLPAMYLGGNILYAVVLLVVKSVHKR